MWTSGGTVEEFEKLTQTEQLGYINNHFKIGPGDDDQEMFPKGTIVRFSEYSANVFWSPVWASGSEVIDDDVTITIV